MQRQKYWLIIGLLIFYLSLTSLGLAAAQSNLKLNLAVGDSYNLRIKAVQQVQQDFFGNQMTIKQHFISKNKYQIKRIDEQGNYILNVYYDDLQLQLENLGGDFGGVKEQQFKTKYNTSMKQAAQSIQGQKFTMKISPRGKLLKLQGYQEIITDWQAAVKKYQTQNNLTGRSGIENYFDHHFMKQLWANILAYLPSQPVKTGDQWRNEFRLTAPLSTTVASNYTLKTVTANKKIITTHAPIEINNLTLPQQNIKGVAYNLTGQQQGKIILHGDSNWIQTGQLKFQAEGTMEVENSMLEAKLSMPVSSFINLELHSY